MHGIKAVSHRLKEENVDKIWEMAEGGADLDAVNEKLEQSCCCVHQKQLLSRFLYPNPVCLLTLVHTVDGDNNDSFRNVMTISWLMPVDNKANILLSINATRFTAEKISALPSGSPFVLNIPSTEQRELVLKVGKCSGRSVDKFTSLGIDTCFPGWRDSSRTDSERKNENDGRSDCPKRSKRLSKHQLRQQECAALASRACALSCCAAHLVCTLEKVTSSEEMGFSDSGHLILSASISHAYVKPEYWNGKQFISQRLSVPPIMSFLGSGEFAEVVSMTDAA